MNPQDITEEDGVVLRPYHASTDHAAVTLLHQDLNRFEAALGADRATSHSAAIQCLAEDGSRIREMGGEQIVALKDGSVVGYIAMLLHKDGSFIPEASRDHVHILNLVVAASHRRQGIARKLLTCADDFARLHGFSRITLGMVIGNHGAEEAYRQAGFSAVAIEMAKRIT
jgi:GNAT superfamily N-acetyltransferase